MAAIYYTVVKGDTLWGIAQKYGTTYQELARINNIPNPNLIYVGQKIQVGDDGGTPPEQISPAPVEPTKSYSVVISQFGLQSDTDRTVFATWTFDRGNVDNYTVMWYYDTGDNVWFVGAETNDKYEQSIYSAPSNAKRVKFKCKPNSRTRTVNGTETVYWNGTWCAEKVFAFADAPKPPDIPPTPTVEVNKYNLTAKIDNYPTDGITIEFQVVQNDKDTFSTGTATVITSHASYGCVINPGDKYKVRARAMKNNLYSEWSEYSSNVSSMPSTPSDIVTIRGTSATSIYLAWTSVNSATSYDIEYTTNVKYFDGSDQTQTITGVTTTTYEKTGLESGKEYFFRVRAANDQGQSSWSGIKSIIIGKQPSAPTTWSSTTTVITGGELILYWMHNSQDGSSATYSRLELIVNGQIQTINLKNEASEDDKDKNLSYKVDTSKYLEGVKIQWRVQTAGITNTYGDWSVQRVVDVYAPATLQLKVTNHLGQNVTTLNQFPLNISGTAGPSTQIPTGYHVSIIAMESYDTTDAIGNFKHVNKDDAVFSQYYDIKTMLKVSLSAGDVDFENNISYRVICTVSMNSGLTAERTYDFKIGWTNEMYVPNADVGINEKSLTTQIRPFCIDEKNNYVTGVLLSVYRREFDGSFTLIGDKLPNGQNTYVTDPHPSLDFARYRIVATAITTGAVSYYDLPGYPVGEKSVIIQWDESWTYFDATLSDSLEKPSWAGSMLKLPYNIDVSDKAQVDVELVTYIGRKRPVSYYGTQLNETSTWNVEIAKSDKETLYAIRRLAIWAGDVYVREPSGSGYWANINVSYDQTHCEKTIPVTFEITRVEGGI